MGRCLHRRLHPGASMIVALLCLCVGLLIVVGIKMDRRITRLERDK